MGEIVNFYKARKERKNSRIEKIKEGTYKLNFSYGIAVLYDFNKEKEKRGEDYEVSALEKIVKTVEKDIEEKVEKLRELANSSLEEIVDKKDNKREDNFKNYNDYFYAGENTGHVNAESGAPVFYVDPSFMPQIPGGRVLGLYDPKIHAIYISNDLTESERRFVYLHEEAHAIGIYDEGEADNYAAARVGFNLRRAA